MDNSPPPQYLPHQLSEDSFRRYEPLIKRAVDRFPEETEFEKPSGIAPTTFLARFRDALVSLKKYNWETDVNCTKLWEVAGQYCLSVDPSGRSVWFRVRHRAGRPTDMINEARRLNPTIDASLQTVWKGADEDDLLLLCQLIHRNRIKGPIILDKRFDKPDCENLEEQYNVAIVDDEIAGRTIVN
jgi:hypothetical protein